MKDRRILFWVLLISIAHFSASTKALAGIWDSLPLRPFAITGSGTTGEAPAAYAIPGQDAPQKLVSQFCERVVACMPGESANSVRWQCVLRLTGDEGKNLWAALVSNFAEDPPTTLKLSQWIQQKQAHADPAKYYACLNSLRDFSCEAIQGRYSGTDLSWAGQLIAEAGSCDDVFTGPATAGEFAEKGAIHVFARCLDEQGEGRTCHWQGPPGGNLWGNQYWFHQLPMKAGQPISVDYHHGAKTLSMVAYVKDGGDLGGAGSVHAMRCKTDGFKKDAFDCGEERRLAPDKVHYNPAVWSRSDFYYGQENRPEIESIVFFNTGTWPNIFGSNNQEKTGLIQFDWIDSTLREDGTGLLKPWGSECEDRAIDHSPSYLVTGDSNLDLFAVGGGNRILHTRGFPGGVDRCMLFVPSSNSSHIRSSPKAIFGESGKKEIYALGEDNYPTRWVLNGPYAASEKLADVKADFKIDNWMGVTLTPNDRFTHVFFRREGTKNIGHVQLDPASGIWRSPDRAGIDPLQVLDSPAAVTDLQGNIHLFVGEKDSPKKPGDNRAYLHHFVKPAGSTEWKSETLTRGNVQHTEEGKSAPTAIFISGIGNTTERNRFVGDSRPDPAKFGNPDASRCKGGGLYLAESNDPITGHCERMWREGEVLEEKPWVRGGTIRESFACTWLHQKTPLEAMAEGLCPGGSKYVETTPVSYNCQDVPPGGVVTCSPGYRAYGSYCKKDGPEVEAEWGPRYSPSLCANGYDAPTGDLMGSMYTMHCCVLLE